MARTRRTWSSLRADIYTHLGESQATSHWDPADLLMYFNEEKDLLEMQLQGKSEGFSTETHTADIVANQRYYSLDAYVGRLRQVIRVFPALNLEIPMVRDEQVSSIRSTVAAGANAMTRYRLEGRYIYLTSIPADAVTGGLKIVMEIASDRITTDGGTLPTDWPLFAETLLVLRTVRAAYASEQAQDEREGAATNAEFVRRLLYYENIFDEYTSRRSFGRTFAVRYSQGG